MTFRNYIADEIATDHADGLLTRRDALRRLILLGLSVTAASSLLAACAGSGTPEATGSPSTGTPATPGPVVPTQAITYPGPDGRTLQGVWAAAASPKGAIIVIHENRGLTDHIRDVAGRFARDGYSALAPDLLSEEGGTAKFTDPAQATAAIGNVPRERFVADLKSSVSELEKRATGEKLGTVGFCFGGGMVWQLLHAGEPRLSAAVPFYGPAPESPDFTKSRAAVFAVYGETDTFVNPSQAAATSALEKAKLTHEIKTYPGTGHAFHNDTGQRYNADAAKQAYADTLNWFGRYLN